MQWMLLRLQRYRLRVKYKKGDQLFLADTLSRAYISDICACEFSQHLDGIDHASSLALDCERLYSESETVQEMILSSQCCMKRYSVDGLSRCVMYQSVSAYIMGFVM